MKAEGTSSPFDRSSTEINPGVEEPAAVGAFSLLVLVSISVRSVATGL